MPDLETNHDINVVEFNIPSSFYSYLMHVPHPIGPTPGGRAT